MSKSRSIPARWKQLQSDVIDCSRCPRLIDHCQTVAREKRRAYENENYWGKPVPDFGSPRVALLIVGLAPGAHGANRTGRMFTGDRSGDWLYRAMQRTGFANQQQSTDLQDGLKLINCAITNICRCAPPQNKPSPGELKNCAPYFAETLELCDPTVVLALGGLAWNATLRELIRVDWFDRPPRRPKFGHGEKVPLNNNRFLLGSYHPSQQNTFTGKLTKPMLDRVFKNAVKLIKQNRPETE
ncbi:MAG: uracil-DNA glycosylase [Mariniblastus sp.]